MNFKPSIVIRFLSIFLGSFIISWWILNGTNPKIRPQAPAVAMENYPLGKSDFFYELQAFSPPAEDLFLIDTVYSLLMKYYVDPKKINLLSLYQELIKTIQNEWDIKVIEEENQFQFSYEDQTVTTNRSKDPSYEDLIHLTLFLKSFIAGFEKDEKNQPVIALLLSKLLRQLDAHSAILSAEEYADLKSGTEGSFGGLGVLVGIRDYLLTVIKPLPRSPAEKVGILKQDRILAIDDLHTYGYSMSDLVNFMRGEPGSEVTLSLLRENAISPHKVQVKRAIIQVDSIQAKTHHRPYGKLLELKIENFTANTNEELQTILNEFTKNEGKENLKGIVVNLSNNPGGLLEQAVKVSENFIKPKQLIVTTKSRQIETKYTQQLNKINITCPMIVITSSDSASASEIMAAALQDNHRAIILGQLSYGKGSVQTIFELPAGKAMKMTIARYYSPAGNSIQNSGVKPDILLQAIHKQTETNNLLGKFRYRQERFLQHHLSAKGKNNQVNPIRGFYLTESQDFHNQDDKDNKYEILTSLKILDILNQNSVDNFPNSNSKNWLQVATPKITPWLQANNQKVSKYLKQKHQIDWSAAKCTNQLDLAVTPQKTRFYPGEDLKINYTVKNHGTSCGQLSVYTHSASMPFNSQEKLIGKIHKKNPHQGTINLTIPTNYEHNKLKLNIGLSQAGEVLTHKKTLKLKILKRPNPKLKLDIAFADGGKIPGKLEPGEKASLNITIHNNSATNAKSMQIKALNLTGKQLIILAQEQKVSLLPGNQHVKVSIPLKGAEAMINQNLDVGLLIESQDLAIPLRQLFSFSAAPNRGGE